MTRTTTSRLRSIAPAVLAPAVLLASLGASAAAPAPSKKPAGPTTPWQVAEAARAQLAQIPPGERTLTDYRTVMDAHRIIYHGNPGDLHAPESIYAVGNLLADEGLVLNDPHALQAAIGQYEFLRKQYPASSMRITAALEEAHVAAAGLHDQRLAREKYTDFVTQFPRSQRVPEARNALAELKAGRLPQVTSGPLAQTATQPATQTTGQTAAQAAGTPAKSAPLQSPAASIASGAQPPATGTAPSPALQNAARMQTEAAANSSGVAQSTVAPGERAEASLRASERTATPHDQVVHAAINPEQAATDDTPASAKAAAHAKNGLAQVTGIRHWSTPTYTRVAIDLGDQVKYEAARVPHPDRIYFDLHGTHLAPELQGKLVNVVDDGFLKRVRIAQYTADSTRVVLDVNDVTEYSAFLLPNPYRLIIDIHGGAKGAAHASTAADTPSTVHAADGAADGAVVGDAPMPATPVPHRTGGLSPAMKTNMDVAALSNQPGKVEATNRPTTQPIAVVADRNGGDTETPATAHKLKRALQSTGAAPPPRISSPDATVQRTADLGSNRAAAPTTDGERSLMRALGLKIGRIVIDPGHGGHDSGTLGADGIMEKDVVLDVALRLGKLLHDHLGAEIIYTRSDDTFIPLETRTAIANKAQADLFLSIHANSSKDETARGVETYYLNFTSDPTALDVAARENAVSDQSVSELSSMVKKITLKDKIDESREFAQDIEQSLYTGLEKGNTGLKNRGVKKAPFVVLIGANMPSILTEISFVTNPEDASKLRTGEYRERVAESIYKGVARYAQGLGGMRVASATPRPDKASE